VSQPVPLVKSGVADLADVAVEAECERRKRCAMRPTQPKVSLLQCFALSASQKHQVDLNELRKFVINLCSHYTPAAKASCLSSNLRLNAWAEGMRVATSDDANVILTNTILCSVVSSSPFKRPQSGHPTPLSTQRRR